MSWTYKISTHTLSGIYVYKDGQLMSGYFDDGLYSGAFGECQNNSDACGMVDQGPIPTGNWQAISIGDDPKTGPNTIVLHPADTPTLNAIMGLGREPYSFRMHGDSIENPGHASEGCIIAPPAVRMAFWNSADHGLTVVP